MAEHTPTSLTLESLTWNMEEAASALKTAVARANQLGLPGTKNEISSALSHVESVLFEIDRKVEDEFARFRDVVGSPGNPL